MPKGVVLTGVCACNGDEVARQPCVAAVVSWLRAWRYAARLCSMARRARPQDAHRCSVEGPKGLGLRGRRRSPDGTRARAVRSSRQWQQGKVLGRCLRESMRWLWSRT